MLLLSFRFLCTATSSIVNEVYFTPLPCILVLIFCQKLKHTHTGTTTQYTARSVLFAVFYGFFTTHKHWFIGGKNNVAPYGECNTNIITLISILPNKAQTKQYQSKSVQNAKHKEISE